jgi:hypothetical protein
VGGAITSSDEVVSYTMDEEDEDSGYLQGGQTMLLHEAAQQI